jgi:hypothetical protein
MPRGGKSQRGAEPERKRAGAPGRRHREHAGFPLPFHRCLQPLPSLGNRIGV